MHFSFIAIFNHFPRVIAKIFEIDLEIKHSPKIICKLILIERIINLIGCCKVSTIDESMARRTTRDIIASIVCILFTTHEKPDSRTAYLTFIWI